MRTGERRAGEGERRRLSDQLFDTEEEQQRLPWLAAEEDEPGSRIDGTRVLSLAIGSLAVLAAMAAALWWLFSAPGEASIVADGSLIEAPEAPYKIRPAEAGGTEVSGTGNVSFAIGEGEGFEGRLEDEWIDQAAQAPDRAAATEVPDGVTGVTGVTGLTGVQVGAYPTPEAAAAAWAQMSIRIPALHGRNRRVVEGSADSGAIYGLQALAGSRAEADALCRAIRSEGGDCQIKD